MQQAIHILKKDARYLYREILLIWILALAFVWIGYVELLLVANAAFLIGRLVHAEAIPGDRQFWITRPYRWQSLLGAKLAFILIFVSLPVALAQLAIVWIDGFPLVARIPGLLWSQGLLTLCVWFPIAALAAMTPSTLVFIFNSLGLLAVGFVGSHALFALALPAPLVPPGTASGTWPSGLEWVRITVAALAMAGSVLAIFYLQYNDRRTGVSRALAVCVLIAGLAVYAMIPWRLAFGLQSWLARGRAEAASIQLAVNPQAPVFLQSFAGRGPAASLHVPLAVSGIPSGGDVRLDVATLTIQDPGRPTWTGQAFSLLGSAEKNGTTQLQAVFPLRAVPAGIPAGRTVRIHVSAYLTLFGHPRERSAGLQDHPVNVTDGLQCFRDRFSVLYCRSAFRWPRAMVYARLTDTVLSPLNTLISYSPYPAVLSLNPVQEHFGTGPPLRTSTLTLVVKEPVAYFERELEIPASADKSMGIPLGGNWILKPAEANRQAVQ
jgi:hypothetical protein